MNDYVATQSFAELPLSDEVRRGIADRGYTSPTPVQAAVLGPILAGKDVICRSKTGTGKTAAFGIPIIERIAAGTRKASCLILCNTRELALQVAQEIQALAAHKDISVVAIYGGASMGDQTSALEKGAEIIVGTPGRVFDHIRRGNLKLKETHICVLDEADEMLGAGFFEEVTRILDHLPSDRQTLLFSATVPADIEQLIQKYMHDPATILLSGDTFTVDHIENVIFYVVDQYPKPRNLLYLLEREDPDGAIIFCNTRTDTELIANVLNRHGLDAEMLNGDLAQKDRERVMAKVKRGELKFMVATDIAARGIDISDLSHVINYSLPEDPAVYLHRVGRTGRMSKKGTAISLVSGAELVTLSALEKKYGIHFETRNLPTPDEAKSLWIDKQMKELHDAMGASSAFEAYLPLAADLAARDDGKLMLAFALKYFFQHHRMERAQARAAGEKLVQSHAVEQVVKEQKEARKKGRERENPRSRRPRMDGSEAESDPAGANGSSANGAGANGSGANGSGANASSANASSANASGGNASGGNASGDEAHPATAEQPGAAPSASSAVATPAQPAAPIDRIKLFVGQGAEAGWDNESLALALSALAGQPRDTVLAIDLKPRHAYVVVQPAAHDAYLAQNGKELRERPLAIEVARPRRR